jgi:hypothetical protein
VLKDEGVGQPTILYAADGALRNDADGVGPRIPG